MSDVVNHSGRKHALLSASGASRWINCTPSARMEESYSDTESDYAKEGTLAHEFGDLELRIASYTGPVSKGSQKDLMQQKLALLRKNPLYTSEMETEVEKYTSYILEEWADAKKRHGEALLLVEEKTDFSHIVPDGFGTSDANIIADELLEVVDLKYGKGVRVAATGNAQGRLYALGVLRKYELIYDIKKVKITIAQVRLDHFGSEVLTVEELNKWAETVVKPAAEKAYAGEGDCNPGDWCRWCSAKPRCKALADHVNELAKLDFAEPKELTDEQILEAYERFDLLNEWASAVQSYMLSEALKGRTWKGLKVVEGRSNRKWDDEQEAIKKLKKKGFKASELTNTKIKGIGDIEKLVGKVDFENLKLTVKPEGKPALVPESDKRPPMFGTESAQKDFAE